jgi:hypothetical protein
MRYKQAHKSVEISFESSLIPPWVSSVIAIVCIAVYIAAIGFAAIRIHRSMADRKTIAEREFQDLVSYTVAESRVFGFMTEPFQKAVTDAIPLTRALEGAIISVSTAEYAFERSRDAAIDWNGSKPEFKHGFGFSKSPLFAPLPIDTQRNVTMQATYSVLDYERCQTILKQTLIAIIISLCVSIFTLILRFLLIRETVPVDESDFFGDNPDDDSFTGDTILDDLADDTSLDDAASAPSGGHAASGLDDLALPTDSDIPFSADISEDEFNGLLAKDEDPISPYSSLGLNWESNTVEKLEEEIHRSEAFKQDITVATVTVEGSGEVFPKLAEEAASYFVLRDLLFERGNRGMIVILPNSTLDDGVARANEFRNQFFAKYPEFQENTTIFAGLSSRCGREVDADRLLIEAGAAVEKADPNSPVVAFRVDPEKYKEFVERSKQG